MHIQICNIVSLIHTFIKFVYTYFPCKKLSYHKKVWWISVTNQFDGSDESYEDTIIHKKASNL
jgi:hypothetical protein